MKPHEETWHQRNNGSALEDSEGGIVGVLLPSERARLASVAPEMARAILGLLQHPAVVAAGNEAAAVTAAQTTLRKAGVL